MPDEADNSRVWTSEPPSKAGRTDFPIIGIGASAGGVDALRRLFPKVDPGCGLAFVVVLHLDPDRGSMLAEDARAQHIASGDSDRGQHDC